MRLPAVFSALMLAACTPMQWVKADADPGQVKRDEQMCQQAAWREAQFHAYWYQHQFQPLVVGPGRVIYPTGAYVDPFAHQLMQENRLAQFCMESKGYQLVPVPKQQPKQ